MADFDVAHIREQGQDMIIIPLKSDFAHKTNPEQHKDIAQLQSAANRAGLQGTVVVVWDAGTGRLAFIAPQPWHAFFRGTSLQWVAMNINRKLTIP